MNVNSHGDSNCYEKSFLLREGDELDSNQEKF